MNDIKLQKAPSQPAGSGNPADDPAVFQALKPYIGHCLNMNHEINNSLAGIIGYAEFLLMDESALSEQQRRQVEMIAKCAEKIRELVQNLCEEKIALAEQIDLRSVMDAYKAVQKKLD